MVPFPEDIVQDLRPIVSFLRTMPIPATHPSHRAAPAIQSALTEAQRGYADMRGTWIKKCLEGEAKRVVEGMGEGYGSGRETNPAESGIKEGQEFGVWVEGLLDVAEVRMSATVSFQINAHSRPERVCGSLRACSLANVERTRRCFRVSLDALAHHAVNVTDAIDQSC